MEELLSQLAGLVAMIQGVAPAVWDAAMRQVAVNARINLALSIVSGVLMLGSLVAVILMMKSDEKDDYGNKEDNSLAILFFGFFFILFLAAFIAFAVPAYKQLANPEWAAIQLLMGR